MGSDRAAEVWLVRHGETAWARDGRHTSITDVPLTAVGEADARALRTRLGRDHFELVLTSPRRRARETAALAGFPDAIVDEDLSEWRYGAYEGLTTEQIRARDPGWTIWTRGGPDGETPVDVTRRLDRLIDRLRREAGPVLCVGHGHALRALGARWIGQPIGLGGSLALEPAGMCILGADRDIPQLMRWNMTPGVEGRSRDL
jgi:broad specificity phosphatase PhoE